MARQPTGRLKAFVAIGNAQGVMVCDCLEIETPDGTFQIGVDNAGKTYLTSQTMALFINPQASNRVRISKQD